MDFTTLYHAAIPYLQQFATIVIIPLAVAFIKSERMALDNCTQGNGIYHWYKLAVSALSLCPDIVKTVETKADTVIPGASQVIEELTTIPNPAEVP